MDTKQLLKPSVNQKLKPQNVNFEFYAPAAKKIFLVGSFNDWNERAHPLKKVKDGRWAAAIQLKPGCYEYRFLVDGIWESDQKPVESVPNAFGSWNCVVTVQ